MYLAQTHNSWLERLCQAPLTINDHYKSHHYIYFRFKQATICALYFKHLMQQYNKLCPVYMVVLLMHLWTSLNLRPHRGS